MNPAPASSATPLSTTRLSQWTSLHPASPRRTVSHFLASQSHVKHGETATTFSPLRVRGPSSSPPANVIQQQQQRARRVSPSQEDEAGGRKKELAMVLHSSPILPSRKVKKVEGGAKEEKRQTLVMKLKGRSSDKTSPMATGLPATKISSSAIAKEGRILQEIVVEQEEQEEGSLSPILVSRVDQKKAERVKIDKRNGAKDDDKKMEKEQPRVTSKAQSTKENQRPIEKRPHSAITEDTGARPTKAVKEKRRTSTRVRKRDRGEEEELSEEDEEMINRLDERRERRRAKAIIVKDRTQSASATGAAAASKLKANQAKEKKDKRDKRKSAAKRDREDQGEDESESEPEERRESKKRRSGSTLELNKTLQGFKRAGNVGASRLTIRPPVKLGLFHKGVASVRTKVGTRLPDLAFSELAFLDGPSRAPAPPSSSAASPASSSSSIPSPKKPSKARVPPQSKPSAPRAPTSTAKSAPVLKTYGTKAKRPSSKYFKKVPSPAPPSPVEQNDASSSPSLPSPPRKKRASKATPAAKVPSNPVAPAPPTTKASVDSSADHSAYSLAQRRARSVPRVISPVASLSIRGSVASAVMDTRNLWGTGVLPADVSGDQEQEQIYHSGNEDQVDTSSLVEFVPPHPDQSKHQTNDPFLDSINSMLDDIAQPQSQLIDYPRALFETAATSFDSRLDDSFGENAEFGGGFIDAGTSMESRRDSLDPDLDMRWQHEEGYGEEERRSDNGMWEHERAQAELPLLDSMGGRDYFEDGTLSLPEADSTRMTEEEDDSSHFYPEYISELPQYSTRGTSYQTPLGTNQEAAPVDREFSEAMKKHWYRSKP